MEKKLLKQKFLQLFIIGYKNLEPDKKFLELIKGGLGGIIFFAENFKSRNEFKKNIEIYKKIAHKPLFLSIDQEGGLVERTIFLDEKVEYLTPKAVSFLDENDALMHYDILAKDLNDLGLNLNFSPVLDVNTNPKNPIIGIRSFGDNSEIVSKYSNYAIKSFQNNGIISCGKHYAGHGDTSVDSHLNMPYINMDFKKFYKNHLICFEKAIKNNLDTIMISHVHFSFFDNEKIPASLSKNAINYLKNELNFKGLIFSDDMVMGGITKHYTLKESIIKGINAGIDNFIFRNYSEDLEKAIDEITELAINNTNLQNNIIDAYNKTIKFKKNKIKTKSLSTFNCKKEQNNIDKLALKTIQIQDNFKLSKNEKIQILSFDFKKIYNLSNNTTNLKALLENYYSTDEILYPINPSNEDIIKILEKINNDTVVIFLSYYPQIHENQLQLFNKIKNKKIFINCTLDLDTKLINAPESIISLYCAKSPSIKTLAKLLIEK